MSLHYLVTQNMCQSVHNHSNESIKRHDKLTVMGKRITTNVQSVCLWVWHTLRRSRHWSIAWSMTLCSTQLTPARDVSSGTLAECICDASLWSRRNASLLGDLIGSFVCPWCTLLTECEIIDCINVLSSTWCARSATPWLSICCAGFSQYLRR